MDWTLWFSHYIIHISNDTCICCIHNKRHPYTTVNKTNICKYILTSASTYYRFLPYFLTCPKVFTVRYLNHSGSSTLVNTMGHFQFFIYILEHPPPPTFFFCLDTFFAIYLCTSLYCFICYVCMQLRRKSHLNQWLGLIKSATKKPWLVIKVVQHT